MCNFYLEGGAALHDGLSDVIKVSAISQPVNHHILDSFTILGLLNETTYVLYIGFFYHSAVQSYDSYRVCSM